MADPPGGANRAYPLSEKFVMWKVVSMTRDVDGKTATFEGVMLLEEPWKFEACRQ